MRKPVVRIFYQVYETNRAVPPQEIARGSKFWIYECTIHVVKTKQLFEREASFFFVFTLKTAFHETAHIIKCINKMLVCVL